MHTLRYSQKLPLTLEKCWEFFSCPRNLKEITPEYLGFQIVNDDDLMPMYAGQIIHYTIKPLWNITLEWVTEITHVQKPNYFIDQQRLGPYRLWHHEHRFEPIVNGVLMHDTLHYQLFFGPIGRVLNFLKVRKDVEGIFEYRKHKLERLFGPYIEVDEK